MEDAAPLALLLLAIHGIIGGIDVVVNHELVERLPARSGARTEEALHSVREAVFAALFAGLAWLEWHGAFCWVIASFMLAEIAVSACDEALEDRTRRLTVFERMTHVFLFLNFGAFLALMAPTLFRWHSLPTGLRFVNYGWLSLALSALGAAAAAWSVRDAIAHFRLGGVAITSAASR
jgi:hypothetical protein